MIKTRFIGTCICCLKQVKVNDGLLAHHGYKRPGYGYIQGTCFGSRREPHEMTKKVAQDFLIWLKKNNDLLNEELFLLYLNKHIELFLFKNIPSITPKRRISCLKENIDKTNFEIKRVEKAVADWIQKNLISVDEFVDQKKKHQKEREELRIKSRKEKTNKAIQLYQKRIDSAARKNNFYRLAEIFDLAPRKIVEINNYKIKRNDALNLLDRNDVWKRLGALDTSGFKPPIYYKEIARLQDWIK